MFSDKIINYQTEVRAELSNLLAWWMEFTIDHEKGGFYGKVDIQNRPIKGAKKGLVLNTRILYTFSAAYVLTPKQEYLTTAQRAYEYLVQYFLDPQHGGFYWAVDENGKKLDKKKQVYGQAFAIYALTAYYKISRTEAALDLAKSTFSLLQQHSYDTINQGYLEAHGINWDAIADLRLSDKDQNEKKSMNTHLHVIEAYANLFTIWKDEELKIAIKQLLINFKQHIINPKNNHLHLFFTDSWEVKSTDISFGHDIEAAWLLQEAAEIIEDQQEVNEFKEIALSMTAAALEGRDEKGGLWCEYDPITNHYNKEMHWWPQAEAMAGFFNAWQINADEQQLANSLASWSFVKNHLRDQQNGEWYWGLNSDYTIMQEQDKAGFWKCPYHNGRACIEIIKRISSIK